MFLSQSHHKRAIVHQNTTILPNPDNDSLSVINYDDTTTYPIKDYDN